MKQEPHHEALTQTVELLTHEVGEVTQGIDKLLNIATQPTTMARNQ